ncbi:Complement C3 [Nibea albiflora]|uniref:Complement C3 n=1 Tax=Nibea albiflora TaxID=240163 RepID=A0ACB7FLM3_NIBAL|nr:Complement C3 [Nibea albiflora]
MRETLLSYSCERRSEYIIDGPDCVNAFLQCCKQMEILRAERKHDSLMLARSEEDENSYLDSNNIVSRSSFPESWQWNHFILPPCKQHSVNCRTTTSEKQFPLKDSITTWQFTGISISRTHGKGTHNHCNLKILFFSALKFYSPHLQGICVGEPLEVKVLQEFFIDLRLPYSAVRGEQIEINAVLHNYDSEKVTVRVELIEMQHVCSSASKRGRYREEVEVGGKTTLSVPFIIIPMKEGHFPIEVKAVVKDSWVKDGVRKTLMVVPPGILTTSLKRITLNPAEKGVGEEQISALVENAISGKSMGTLIKQPSGCGEQNMISMTLPVIATTYLDKTNQWESVGLDKRNEALEHIKTGYQNELHYRKTDGSFAVFPHYNSSTWLTAYVAKVFAMANGLVKVSNDHICEAIDYLMSKTQNDDGSFGELGSIIHGEMIGDVKGMDSDVSMTAFCLIAIQESRAHCNATVEKFKDRIDKAVAYLETRQHSLENSYAAAMTSYALANENKLDRMILSKFISPELTHWPVRDAQLFTLEATGYALLALVKAKAIAEYWINAKEEEYDVNVDIEIPGRRKPQSINFNRKNHYVTRTSKFNKINKSVKVIANGTGEATVTMVSMYYTLPKEKKSNCEKFELSVELTRDNMDTDERIYKLVIKVSHTQPEEIVFRIHQKQKVGVLQPAAVSVYEYYNHQHNIQNCSMQKMEKINNRDRTAKACETKVSGRIDYVYRVRLENFTHTSLTTDIYTMRVVEAIKEENCDVGPLGNLRPFLSYQHCRVALNLKLGKTYLIMGMANDIHKDVENQSFQYILGERTWIEYWPTEGDRAFPESQHAPQQILFDLNGMGPKLVQSVTPAFTRVKMAAVKKKKLIKERAGVGFLRRTAVTGGKFVGVNLLQKMAVERNTEDADGCRYRRRE